MKKLLFTGLILMNLILLSSLVAQEGSVSRAVFTSEIVDREPANKLDTVYTDVNKVFYFTELKECTGQKISHRWIYGDQILAEVAFEVKGPRWRVHSSKNLTADWVGDWRVEVADSQNNVIHEDAFVYLAKPGAMTRGDTAPAQSIEMKKSVMTTSPEIKRAIFTTNIVDREPENEIDSLYTDVQTIYFFTETLGMEGKSIKHRWNYKGQVMAEVPFEVKGPRWRIYSSKNLISGWVGTWSVEVVDGEDNVLAEQMFEYIKK